MPRGQHSQKHSDADWNAIFQHLHGTEERAYYGREPASLIRSTLDARSPGYVLRLPRGGALDG